MKLVASLLSVITPALAGPLDLFANYDFENGILADTFPPEGMMWTDWSNWYGCENMDADKWDDYPANIVPFTTDDPDNVDPATDINSEIPSNHPHGAACTNNGDGCVSPPWENKRAYCLHSARYLAQSVRYRECTLPDAETSWEGDMNFLDWSRSIYRTENVGVVDGVENVHNMRVRDQSADVEGIQPGHLTTEDYETSFHNRRPPTGDPRVSFNEEQFNVAADSRGSYPTDVTNFALSYKTQVSRASNRFACDPRVEQAAKICLDNNFCQDHGFQVSDMMVAFNRVGTRITRGCFNVEDLGLSPAPAEAAEGLGCSKYGQDDDGNYNHFFGHMNISDFMDAMTTMAALKADYGSHFTLNSTTAEYYENEDSELRYGENAEVAVSLMQEFFASTHQAYGLAWANETGNATIDFFMEAMNGFEDVRYLMWTQLKIIIELELQRGSEWKTAIPEPYLTLWYDYAICVDNCPIPLPWTSWSCHCKKGSDLTLLNGDDSNPDGLPECDCQKQKRYRVQVCRDNNDDYLDDNRDDDARTTTNDFNCRDTEDADGISQDNCLSCNIYHDYLWNGGAPLDAWDRYDQKYECNNYGWNTPWTALPEDDDADMYDGLNMRRVFYASGRQFQADLNLYPHNRAYANFTAFIDEFSSYYASACPDYDDGSEDDSDNHCNWPTIWNLFPEWWNDWIMAHPYELIDDDTSEYDGHIVYHGIVDNGADVVFNCTELSEEDECEASAMALQKYEFIRYYGIEGNGADDKNFQGFTWYHVNGYGIGRDITGDRNEVGYGVGSYLNRYCYFDIHDRTHESYKSFVHQYSEFDEFAIQYDECSRTSQWGEWAPWSDCSQTCGGGINTRQRDCMAFNRATGNFDIVDNTLIGQDCECEGERTEEGPCNEQCCLIWHQCTEGSDCVFDSEFEVGTAWNMPPCTGCGCPTVYSERRCMCNNGPNAIDGEDVWLHAGWLSADLFNIYPGCPVTDEDTIVAGAGAYRTTREEVCTGLPCCGDWTAWTDWSACDVESCRDCDLPWDPREKTRERFCGCSSDPRCPEQIDQAANGVDEDTNCGGRDHDIDEGLCNDVAAGEMAECCPEPCCMETYSLNDGPYNEDDYPTCPWSTCDLTCRPIQVDGFDNCVDLSNQTRHQTWDCCQSIRNNNNEHVRFDVVANDEVYCPAASLHYEAACDAIPYCCEYSEWSDWDTCKTADLEELACTLDPTVKMYTTRHRYPFCNTVDTCGDCLEIKECDVPLCAGWAQWGGWSECSCDCGKVGTQARTRACEGAEIGSEYCPCNGDPTLEHITGIDSYEPRCAWGATDDDEFGIADGVWNDNGQCDLYGYGDTWDANVAAGSHDANDPGYFQVRRCNQNPQPCSQWRRLDNTNPNTDLYWSAWSHCDAECGIGKETRQRECVRVYSEGGLGFIEQVPNSECDDELLMGEHEFQERDCRIAICQDMTAPLWGHWSECSTSCQGPDDELAIRHRYRACANEDCEDEEYDWMQTEQCPRQQCPHWLNWEQWTPCSEPCRGREGFTKRERECSIRDLVGFNGCQGDNFEYMECNEHIECPTWSDWGPPTECYFIGDPEIGERDRTRYCMNGNFGLDCPFERRVQTSPCKVCDESITRPRVYVRRAEVTLRVSLATDLEWDPAFADPDSQAYLDALAQVQSELDGADLEEGQTAVVTGLSLCPASGCRRRRDDGEGDTVHADVDVVTTCEGDECTQDDVDAAQDAVNSLGAVTLQAEVNQYRGGDDNKKGSSAKLVCSLLLFATLLFFM